MLGVMMMSLCLMMLISQMVESAPYDYENLRDLYEILLRNEGIQSQGSRFVHQMERKGGRSPTLRLRFGKRADPMWAGQAGAPAETADSS